LKTLIKAHGCTPVIEDFMSNAASLYFILSLRSIDEYHRITMKTVMPHEHIGDGGFINVTHDIKFPSLQAPLGDLVCVRLDGFLFDNSGKRVTVPTIKGASVRANRVTAFPTPNTQGGI
jgi:hypothetical protein